MQNCSTEECSGFFFFDPLLAGTERIFLITPCFPHCTSSLPKHGASKVENECPFLADMVALVPTAYPRLPGKQVLAGPVWLSAPELNISKASPICTPLAGGILGLSGQHWPTDKEKFQLRSTRIVLWFSKHATLRPLLNRLSSFGHFLHLQILALAKTTW